MLYLSLSRFQRMAELQKRMEEKTARTHTFGPFSERDYFSDRDTLSGVNRYYDDLEAEQKQAEEDYNRSLKTFNPHNFVKEKNHMGMSSFPLHIITVTRCYLAPFTPRLSILKETTYHFCNYCRLYTAES